MEIYLFQNFGKRENSTRAPALDTGNKFECVLKEPTSITDPVIEIRERILNYYYKYNYAYIPDFNRYYFIDNIRSEGLLWVYSLRVDVLASYVSNIEKHGFYILRSSTEHNGKIQDTYYPVSFDHKTLIKRYPTMWASGTGSTDGDMNIENGVFVLGIVAVPASNSKGSYGSIKYYAFEQKEFYQLVHYLLTNVILDGVNGFNAADATISLQKSLINPLSYIKSCIWLPIGYDSFSGTEQTNISVWDWTVTDCTAKLLTSDVPYRSLVQFFKRHNHPQITRGEYMNTSPYTRTTICYPPFGVFELDTAAMINSGDIVTTCKVDLISGLGTFDISAYTDTAYQLNGSETGYNLLNRVKAQIGVPIQLSEIGYDYSNVLASAVGIGAEALLSNFGNAMNSTISNAISQIGTAANAMRTKSSSLGSNGGFSELSGWAVLYEDYYLAVDEDLAHLGRPLCKIRTLQQLGHGYYIVRDGDLELKQALFSEMQQIKTYLESGIFYE